MLSYALPVAECVHAFLYWRGHLALEVDLVAVLCDLEVDVGDHRSIDTARGPYVRHRGSIGIAD